MERVSSPLAVLALIMSWPLSAAAQPAPDAPPATPPADDVVVEGADTATESPDEDDLAHGEVIVITGSRVEQKLAATTMTTEVITRKEIEAGGYQTVSDILQEQPGIELVDGLQGTSVQVQGLDPGYVLILVDGKRAIGRVLGAIDLERYHVENIERIEIVKGASSALYGSDALAGVVNIITRKSERPVEGEVTTQAGNLGVVHTTAMVGAAHGPIDTRFSAGYHRGDGWDLDPATIHTTGSAFRDWQVANQTNLLVRGVALSASLDCVRRDLSRIDSSIAGSDDIVDDATAQAMATLDRRSLVEIATGSLSARFPLDGGHALTARVGYSYYRDQLAYDQRGSNDLDLYEETLESLTEASLQFDGTFAGAHLITAGFDGMYETLDSPRLRERSGDVTCDAHDPEADCDTTGDRSRSALFMQDEWLILRDPALYLVPGMRLDVDSQFGNHATPKLALRWDPLPSVTARASYGHGYRAPDFKQLYLCFENINAGYYVVGNPDLQPERSHNVNLNVEHRRGPRLWASVSLYYNTLDNLISFELAEGQEMDALPSCSQNLLAPYTHRNIASAFTRGGEALVRVRPRLGPIDGITVEAGYTLTDSRDRETDTQLPGRARHRGTLKLGYESRRLGLSANLRGNFVGRRAYYELREGEQVAVEAEPYQSVNARVEQVILRRYHLFAGVNNLFNQGDVQVLPIAPRTFYLGMRARY